MKSNNKDSIDVKSINIIDAEEAYLDASGKTSAYFTKLHTTAVNRKVIDELKHIAINDKYGIRLCLHGSSVDNFHNMIIAQSRDKFYPIHKHPTKPECYHLIEGELGVLHFNQYGVVTSRCMLSMGGNVIYRINYDEYHVVFPMTEVAIYHESKPGPFVSAEDIIIPEWCGCENNTYECYKKYFT